MTNVTYLGLGNHTLDWGEQRDITIESQRRFQPAKLGIPLSATAYGVMVLLIKVGTDVLLRAPMPVEMLSEVSTFPQPIWPELGPGRPITFTLLAPPAPPAPPPLKWWQRLWRWLLRRKPPAPPRLPTFAGAFYGVLYDEKGSSRS